MKPFVEDVDCEGQFAASSICGAACGGATRQSLADGAGVRYRLRFVDGAALHGADDDLTTRV